MTQLKIIRIRGHCRGRPPTEDSQQSAARGSPFAVSGQRSAVSGLEPWNPGTLKLWNLGTRNPLPGTPIRESSVTLSALSALVVKRQRGSPGTFHNRRFGIWSSIRRMGFGIYGSKRSIPLHPLPRAWPDITCSTIRATGLNRDNDSRKERVSLAGKRRDRKDMRCYVSYRLTEETRKTQGKEICDTGSLIRENLFNRIEVNKTISS